MICGVYKHYSGRYYRVLGTALHTETSETLVVYIALYHTPELKESFFVRPYDMFFSDVEIDGKTLPRFELVKDSHAC